MTIDAEFYENLQSVAKLLGDLAGNVADAQARLNDDYVKSLGAFAQLMKTVEAEDKASMEALFRDLAPARYAFTETVLEVRADLQMSSLSEFSVGGSAEYKTPVFAATINASYTKRNGYDARASALIRSTLNAVLPNEKTMELLLARAGEPGQAALPADSRYKGLADAIKTLAPAAS